ERVQATAMEVLVAGGHGQIAQRLLRLLSERGHRGRGMIRNPDHAPDLEALGAEPVLCDLEQDDPTDHIGFAQAIVFAAGAGPGSGAERKRTMDLGGALKLIEAARAAGARRYLMISAMGAARPPAEGGEVYGEYLRAKAEADRALEASGLNHTIVRPGRLTDDPPSGRVTIGNDLPGGEVSRADVAATLAAALRADSTIGTTFELLAGETPIEDALAAL
ncbi:MAG TPA: NAD(P)H-binding protein, partial [Solirubrobacterales bacterium]|nr:NAD(P)H-binding protein [Solirubrobacterales bacterium]